MSSRPGPQHWRRDHQLSDEQTETVKRLLGINGAQRTSKMLGCSPHTVEELASNGKAMRATIERLAPAIDALRGAS